MSRATTRDFFASVFSILYPAGMSSAFDQILLHPFLRRVLARAVERPASAYLFVGPDGIGKRTAAEKCSRALLDLEDDVSLESHPDFYRIVREEDAKEITVGVIRAALERAALSSARGGHRVMLMDEADRMNEEAANALLKVVEEPPAGLVWIFLAERPERLPATLRSRLVTLRFERMRNVEIETWLQTRGVDQTEMARAASAANGCPGKALRALEKKEDAMIASGMEEQLLDAMRSGPSGRALQAIEFFTKNVEASEDASGEWRRALERLMRALEPQFLSDPEAAIRISTGLIRAWYFSERAVSPRLALELASILPYAGGELPASSF